MGVLEVLAVQGIAFKSLLAGAYELKDVKMRSAPNVYTRDTTEPAAENKHQANPRQFTP